MNRNGKDDMLILDLVRIGDVEALKRCASVASAQDVSDIFGDNLLAVAAGYGHIEMTRYLISQGAKVRFQNLYGETALHHASAKGHVGVVWLLIDHEADVNAVDGHLQTPLHSAACYGRIDVIKSLLREGSRLNATDDESKTAKDVARNMGHGAAAQLLRTAMAEAAKAYRMRLCVLCLLKRNAQKLPCVANDLLPCVAELIASDCYA